MDDHQRLHSSKSKEWYTPKIYIEAARAVMDGIELDPASCVFANDIVKARRYFAKEDDGLNLIWRARSVWLNPPYGRGPGHVSNQQLWSEKLIAEYNAGRVQQGIMLVNAVTDRVWFQPLWSYPICFTDHRIAFIDRAGNPQDSPTHGNAFIGIGVNERKFLLRFSRFGRVVAPLQIEQTQPDPDQAEIYAMLDTLRAGWGIETTVTEYARRLCKEYDLPVGRALGYIRRWAGVRLGDYEEAA